MDLRERQSFDRNSAETKFILQNNLEATFFVFPKFFGL